MQSSKNPHQYIHNSENHINSPPPNQSNLNTTSIAPKYLLLEMPPYLETRNSEHDPLSDRVFYGRPVDYVLPHDLPPFDECCNVDEHIQ
jgi:hypothetical protein